MRHEIVTIKNETMLLCPIFQVSPEELVSTKYYVSDLLRTGNILPSRSLYAYHLFFKVTHMAVRTHVLGYLLSDFPHATLELEVEIIQVVISKLPY